ncbi:MAG: C25 family cysteine peptidase [Candidatus Aenigmatarchaeota archaeon]
MKGLATEIILTIGVLIAVGITAFQLRGIYIAQQQLGEEEVISAFIKDLESIVDRAIGTTGDAAFIYYPIIKQYKVEIENNVVRALDKISGKQASFSKTAPKIVENQFEDCEKIFVLKKEGKIVLMCRCLELEESCSDSLLCCSGYCNQASGKCEEIPICSQDKICTGAPEAKKDFLGRDCCPSDLPVCTNGHCCPMDKPKWCDQPKDGSSPRCMDEEEYENECEKRADVLIITVSGVVYKIGQDLINEYKSALISDGYSPKLIQLDVENDVKECDTNLSPSSVPVPSSDAQKIIPKCVIKYNARYVVILGGHNYIRQKEVPIATCYDPLYSHFYSDDWYVDIDSDSKPDVAIGRIPDSIDHNDDVIRNYLKEVAIPLHKNERTFSPNGKFFAYMMGKQGSSNYAYESEEAFMIKNFGSTCNSYSNCYISPPNYNGGPDWGSNSKWAYIFHHGNPFNVQRFSDDNGRVNILPSTTQLRDWSDTVVIAVPCYGGRIHNVDFSSSIVLNILNGNTNGKPAIAYFGGTATQFGWFGFLGFHASSDPCLGSCTSCLYDKIYNSFFTAQTIGDAYIKGKNLYLSMIDTCGGCSYRIGHQTQLYGDPSIRIK